MGFNREEGSGVGGWDQREGGGGQGGGVLQWRVVSSSCCLDLYIYYYCTLGFPR